VTAERRLLFALGGALAAAMTAPTLLVGVEAAAFVAARPAIVATVEAHVGPVCHHLPGRTQIVAGHPLPVCARCVGMYAGAAAGGLAGIVTGNMLSARPRLLRRVIGGVCVATLTAFVAAVLELAGVLSTGNALRMALGVPLGLGPALLGGVGARVLLAAAVAPDTTAP
jgi:uncharacterized membrane protein